MLCLNIASFGMYFAFTLIYSGSFMSTVKKLSFAFKCVNRGPFLESDVVLFNSSFVSRKSAAGEPASLDEGMCSHL